MGAGDADNRENQGKAKILRVQSERERPLKRICDHGEAAFGATHQKQCAYSLAYRLSLMSLQLWTLIDLAGPIFIILAAQLFIAVAYSTLIVFRVMGKSYDAAVIAAGYVGLTLGATPTAIANMTAVTKQFGASPLAFIVVPLVGAFFIDISNAIIIKLLLSWL